METGDGLLARLAPPDGAFAPGDFLTLCGASRRHGNGLIEVTARGSLQVRGLTAAGAPAFAAEVGGGAGLTVTANPLAGLDFGEILDVRPLARALKRAADERFPPGRLAPKVSVVIDGGGALHLDGLNADIRLKALPPEGAPFPQGPGITASAVSLGSARGSASLVRECGYWLFINDVCLGAVSGSQALDAMLRLLDLLAERGPLARARDLSAAEGAAAVVGLVSSAEPPAPRPRPEPLGRHALKDGTWALGIGLAFGQAEAESLAALAEGVRAVHPAPGRVLLLVGVPETALDGLTTRAEALGFVTRPEDPRRAIAACPGAPACGAGQIAARVLAPAVADSGLLDGSVQLHLSGCAKGCAQPAAAALTLVGREGLCDLVLRGTARGPVVATLPAAALAAGLRRLARQRRSGESMAAALARLGGAGVAAVVLGRKVHG